MSPVAVEGKWKRLAEKKHNTSLHPGEDKFKRPTLYFAKAQMDSDDRGASSPGYKWGAGAGQTPLADV